MSEEGKTDLSSFDSISDRVARAKAKAEAMRAAKAASGGAPAVPKPAAPPVGRKAPSLREAAPAPAAAAAPETAPAERKAPPPREAAPPPEPPAAPAVAPAAPAPRPMSTVEMAAATRRQRAATLSKAALATKAAEPAEAAMSRRGFFSWLAVAWVAFTAAMAAGGAAVTRFMFPNVLFEPPQVFKAGLPEDYDVGKVDERWKEKFGVWIVRNEQGIYALSTTCTHLGCTPNWLEGENKFKCPCHGSGFYQTGINFEGPAPRPLERYRVALADDGQILVDKNKIYQQEKGQWDDPESFLKLA